MTRLRKGLFGAVGALWLGCAVNAWAEGGVCPEPACVELEADAGLAQLSVALAKPAGALTMDAPARKDTVQQREIAVPLSMVAVLFGLIGVVALARRRMGG